MTSRSITVRAVGIIGGIYGIIGGIYGIGGGSLLSPILVGCGFPVSTVAPAALASTFLTSILGALTYTALALTTPADIAPAWTLGLLCGLGGLIGGYLGARLQPRLPEPALRSCWASSPSRWPPSTSSRASHEVGRTRDTA
jgi:hypothetical protein